MAYIVIPAGFSADIESLNTVMSKSNLTYEFNKQLAQEKKITILKQVDSFIQSMADDIAGVLSTGTYDTGSPPVWTVHDGTVTMDGAAYTLTAADGTLNAGELERLLSDYRQNSSGTYREGAASADIRDEAEIRAIALSLLPGCGIERFVEDEDGTFTEGDAQENRKEADRLFADSLAASGVDLAADEDYKIEPISQTKLDDIIRSLRSDVVSPLLNRADEVKHAFQSSYADSDGKLSTFQSSMTAYDPIGHIDSSAIQDSYADMHDSTSSLQKEVLEKDTDRLESMVKTYETYTANEVALQQHIQEATKASEEAVVQGLAGAQKVKEESSRDNQERMESFTGKLPYTRIGKAENLEAGRFIVDPFWVTEQNTAGNTDGGNLEDDAVPASGSEVKEASATGRAVLEVLGAFAILGVRAMQEYTELRSFLDTIVNSKLPELWQGAGAEAYITRYQELAPSFQAIQDLIQDIGTGLQQNATYYEEADQAASAANSGR
ncbi:WXG100 family type VII secretion target [Extibacter muris]|uniref:WXG100 family type VII secretion target n=1 Tax=Extibacter muris TaxID=1796622 RepID=A0A4R4FEA0_9FIRM|nr:WXG100 family type VII secretion target [Extibacter muris]MCU0078720.1 WXG100 family type VII secretion target [Extibacter muris]TDA21887.1 WXG100 family type VII secretion target [Extibacter muris]